MPSKIKTCDDYREALIEAAASGAEPSRELRLHMNACSSCQAMFAQERQLFADIDTGLRSEANAEVPASLLPRVRLELSARSVRRFSWVPSVAAMAAVAAAVLAVVFIRGAWRGMAELNQQTISVARKDVAVPTHPSLSVRTPESNELPAGQIRTRRVKASPRAKSEEPTVLVPLEQKRAMEILLASLQRGKVAGEVLLAEEPEKPLEELKVAPLDLAPIEVKPLADVSEESAPQSEKTNR
jgi:anti-sigma factor RsiW